MILEKFSLANKVAIVTGATRGIGMAIAIGLAEAGADLVTVGRSDDSEVRQAVQALGRGYLNVRTDVGGENAPDLIVSQAVERFGHIDILVNAAGITRRTMALEMTRQEWNDVMAVNLDGLFFLCQRAAQQFIKQGTKGKIVNIASLLSFVGGVKVIAYTASKSAVRGITMHMSNEWAKYNIQVNAIAPGYVETELTKPMRGEAERVKETLVRIPAGRWAKPEDMVGTAVFLSSDASDYISGYTIAVDGGCLGR